MDAVKKAIKGALTRGDAHERTFREKIYRQTFAALDRSLEARPNLSAQEAQERRERLKAVIIEVEREFLSAQAVPSPQDTTAPKREAPPTRRQPDPMPQVENDDLRPTNPAADGEARDLGAPLAEEQRRRPIAMLFLLAVLLAAAGIGAWWMSRSDILGTVLQSGPALPYPPMVEEPSSGATSAPDILRDEAGREWITIFSPGDPTSVTASAGASAEAVSDGETYLRIGSGPTKAAVSFDIGQGTLERLAGQRAVFSLTTRSAEGETQISISCDFGVLGDCGRTRYVVGPEPSEYLFEVELPDRTPRAGGQIAIISDIEGKNRMLDIYSLRVKGER